MDKGFDHSTADACGRRRFLAATACSSTAVIAGCAGGEDDTDTETDDTSDDSNGEADEPSDDDDDDESESHPHFPPRFGGEADMPEYVPREASEGLRSGNGALGVKAGTLRVAAADPDRLYLGSAFGGAFRSDDGGDHWYMLHHRLPHAVGNQSCRDISVHPDDEDEVLLAVGIDDHSEGLYRTENGGAEWEHVGSELTFDAFEHRQHGRVIDRHPEDGDVVVAATSGGTAYRSTDGGESWSAVSGLPDDLEPADVRFNPDEPDEVLLTTLGDPTGVYRSTDGGASWSETASIAVREFAFDPVRSRIYALFENTVVVSVDGGESWNEFDNGLSGVGNDATFVRIEDGFDGGASGVLLINVEYETVYELVDGAIEWQPRAEITQETFESDYRADRWDEGNDYGNHTLYTAVQHPEDPQRVFAAGRWNPFVSDDLGETWSYAGHAANGKVMSDLSVSSTTVHTASPDTGYVRFVDGGTIADAKRMPGTWRGDRVEVSPVDSNYVYFQHCESGSGGSELYRSTDGGDSWELVPIDDAIHTGAGWIETLAPPTPTAMAPHPSSPESVVVAPNGESSAYRSDDAMDSWEELPGLPTPVSDSRHSSRGLLAVSSADTIVVGGGESTGASVHRESGWTEIATLTEHHAVDVAASNVQDGHFVAVAKPETDDLTSVGGDVFQSTDQGDSWTKIYDGGDAHRVAYHQDREGHIAVATTSGEPTRLSTDDGSSWAELPALANVPIGNVDFAGDHLVYLSESNGVFRRQLP